MGDLTARLPPELVLRLFDDWDFADIQSVLRCNVQLRQILLVSPAYCHEIKLASSAQGALELFLLRLSRAGSLCHTVTVDLLMQHDPLLYRSVVLPAIVAQLQHIRRFGLQVAHCHAGDALRLVRLPAPQLQWVEIGVALDQEEECGPIVPEDSSVRRLACVSSY